LYQDKESNSSRAAKPTAKTSEVTAFRVADASIYIVCSPLLQAYRLPPSGNFRRKFLLTREGGNTLLNWRFKSAAIAVFKKTAQKLLKGSLPGHFIAPGHTRALPRGGSAECAGRINRSL